MKEFDISTVVKYWCYSKSMMHVSITNPVAPVGELAPYLDINSLCLLPTNTVLLFRVVSLLYLNKRWYYRITLLCYSVKSFPCKGMKVYLIWSCFISYWTANIHFLTHFLGPDLSERWLTMTAVTSDSFWTDPWLKNSWASGFRTLFSAIFQRHMHIGSMECLGYRTWYALLLWKIFSFLR